ncbi:ANKRD52, partial [Symbiodinium sp. KB8]
MVSHADSSSCPAGDLCPSELRPSTLTGRSSACPAKSIDIPSRHDPDGLPEGRWLGITMYSPFHQTAAFALPDAACTDIPAIHAAIRAEGRLQCEEHDQLVPLCPQLFAGYLYLLSFPSVIVQGRRPHCAVVLDLSRVGGPCYADVVPIDLCLNELWEKVGHMLNIDVQDVPVHVWIGEARQPASRGGVFNLFHGVLITVVRADIPGNQVPPPLYSAIHLLQDSGSWGRIDHMLSPRKAHCLAVCCGLKIDPVFPAFFPRFFKAEVALRVCRLDSTQATVFLVDNQPILGIQGEPCQQTAVVVPSPPLAETSEGPQTAVLAYFLDLRPLGIAPRLVVLAQPNPDLPDILGAADVEFPAGLCGVLLSNRLYGSLQILRIGWAPDLATAVCDRLSSPNGQAQPTPVTASASPSGPSAADGSFPFGPGHAGQAIPHNAPTDVRPADDPPTAHAALNLASPDAELVEIVTATFVVFSPRFRYEVVRLELSQDCEVEQALVEVSEARRSDVSVAFDCLLEVDPQPDLSFASVLAVPVWAACKICLVDTRAIDGRLYSQQFTDELNRSSILLQIEVPDLPGTRVFLAGRELAAAGLHSIPHGGLLLVVPSTVRLGPRFQLSQLLTGLAEWDAPCPFLDAGTSTEFLMLSDGLPRILPVDLDGITTSAKFKLMASEAFRYSVDATTICPTIPRISDLVHLGRMCQAVIAATERICRIPVPPGRLMVRQHIAFLDRRLLLEDVTWLLAPHGVLEVSHLEKDYLERAPFGHSLSITVGRRETRGYREFIHVAHGEVLGMRFVEDLPADEVDLHSSPSDGDPSHGGSRSDPDSDSDDSAPSSSESEPDDKARSANRSRSPRGARPPPPSDDVRSCKCLVQRLLPIASARPPFWPSLPTHVFRHGASYSISLVFADAAFPSCARDFHSWGPPVASHFMSFMSKLGVVAGDADLGLRLGASEWGLFGAALSCKTLDEPTSSSPRLQMAINCLRYFALRIGDGWRYRSPNGAAHVVSDGESDASDGDSDAEPMHLHFTILTPGFGPERVAISLRVPVTLHEAISELQSQRVSGRAYAFPHVVPARPQPCPGSAVVLALPAWYPTDALSKVFLCFDTSIVDGRVFAVPSPPYVSRRHLLHLAHLLDRGPFDVHLGDDPVPLAGAGQHHVATGDVVLFVPAGAAVPTLSSLAVMLLSRQDWSSVSTFPRASADGQYGLIHDSEAVLFFSHFEEPTTYRAQIAACVGIRQQQLRIFPSSPRVCNATLNGHPCRTIIAVYELFQHTAGPPFCVLVDARALLQGWRTIAADAGHISCDRLRADLQTDLPAGWRVSLCGILDDVDLIAVSPGQVIVAEVISMPAPIEMPNHAPDGTSDETVRGTGAFSADAAPSPDIGTGTPGHPSNDYEDFAAGTDVGNAAPCARTDAAAFRACSFLIAGQNYALEHVEVRLHVDVTLPEALRAVSAARAPRAVGCLPLVQAVYPQPQGVLGPASPTWVLGDEASFLFDVRPSRYHFFWHDVAGAVRSIASDLTFQYALLDPPDFAYKGTAARDILAALRSADFLPSVTSWPVVCFIDARPLLLSITYQVCPDGLLDVNDVIARYVPRCPAGYEVRLFNSTFDVQQPGSLIAVAAGEVLTVLLCFVGAPVSVGPPNEPFDDDDGSVDPRPDGGMSPRTLRDFPSASSVVTSSLADTGGTGHVDAGRHVHPVQSFLVTWLARISHDAVLAGSWRTTSVWSLAGWPELDLAVCRDLFSNLRHCCTPICSGDLGHDLSGRVHGNHIRTVDVWGCALYFAYIALLLWAVASRAEMVLLLTWVCSLASNGRNVRRLFGICLLLGVSGQPAAAMQLRTPAPGRTVHADVPRPLCSSGPAHFFPPAPLGNRTLPTPCRGRCSGPPSIGAALDVDVEVNTLLWEAVRRPDCQAYFLAATLLDTLIEHFEGAPVTATLDVEFTDTAVDASVPVRLCLADALSDGDEVLHTADCCPAAALPPETQCFDLEARQCQLPCSVADVQQVFSHTPFSVLQSAPTGLDDPDRFREWVAQGYVGRSPAPNEVLVLTSDGSFSDRAQTAGWAVAVSLVPTDMLCLPGQFIGCFGGSMRDFQAHLPDGTPLLDPYLAEVAGLLCASIAAAQLPWHGTVLFRADNIAALTGVQGSSGLTNHPLCLLARDLHSALQVGHHCHAYYQHVLGHSGDAANELADALASRSASNGRRFFPFGFDFSYWCGMQGLRSRWLPHLCMALCRAEEFPTLHADVHSWARGSGVCHHPPEFAMAPFLRDAFEAPTSAALRPATIRLVTYNALSLLGDVPSTHPLADGLHGATGRVALLARILDAKQISLAGLQECRTPKGTFHCAPYRRLASGSDSNACYGVELWLHRDSPVEAASAVVLHADPTRIIVSATCAGSPIRLIVAHDLNGDFLHQLLSFLSSWLPATFPDCAYGDGGTLYQKRNGSLDRSDYVGVPDTWARGLCQAWVDPHISSGHACLDHFAAVVSVYLDLGSASRRKKATRIDATAISDPVNQERVEQIIRAAPRPAWAVDASEHAAVVVEHLYSALAQQFPASKRRMRASYLSEQTGALHQAVSGLRHRVRAHKLALRAALLRCALLAWRSAGVDFASLFVGPWLWQLRTHYGLCCMLLRRFGLQLRRQCRTDRAAHFERLADEINGAEVQVLHQQVKRVLKPKRYRKAGADPLPLLLRKDGSVCQSLDESIAAWRTHFGDLEDGVPVSVGDLVTTCRARQQSFVGTDSVPTQEVIFQAAEPAGLKGGRRGCSADMGHFFLSCGFFHYCQVRGLSCAVLFLDLTSAYYGVIRETVMGSGLTGRSLEAMAESLSLTKEDLQLLRHYVACEPVLESQNASTLLSELTREMHASTWFVLAQDSQVMHTHRGTRPGGALADIVFNVLFGKVLQRRDPQAFRGTTPVVPWDGAFSPFPSANCAPETGEPQSVGDVIYADDLATFVVSNTAAGLRPAISGVASATLDVWGPHGLRPNYGPRKTAAIIAAHGKGSRQVRREFFGDLRAKLTVFLEHAGAARIDLVTHYKHLGSHLTYDGSMLTEIKYRLALGRAAFKEGRQRLFACKRISIQRRASLFRTHVLSAVLAGAGTWPWLSTTEWQTFSGGIINLYRQLLCLKTEGGYEVTTAQILTRCGLPSPTCLLSVARLRFLGQLTRHGPAPAWAILRWYSSFQRAAAAACRWLLQAVAGTSTLGDPVLDWESWRVLILDRPGHWKGLLKRAEAWHCEATAMVAAIDLGKLQSADDVTIFETVKDDRPDIFGQWESQGLDAARRGDVTRLQELLSDGWRPFDAESLDHNGASALDWAAGAGHREVVELLLPLAEGIQCCRRDGRGPAHWAARHGQTEVLRLLVERRAFVNLRTTNGGTMLMLASYGGHLEACEALLALRADLFARNAWDCDAGHFAAMGGSVAVCRWLAAQGLSLCRPQVSGHTALDK